jgi:ADP-ribose pyrophosphatase YjhB (NUDIX family)
MKKEKVLLNATLCFPVKEDKVLLGIKMKNIGQGCWNGWGGGIHRGETPLQAIVRETREEAGVETLPEDFEKMAIMRFCNTKKDGKSFICQVHIYLLHHWEGDFRPSKEIVNPMWFKKTKLPLSNMMPADSQWLPIILSGKKIIGAAHYGPFQKTLIGKVRIKFVDSFP